MSSAYTEESARIVSSARRMLFIESVRRWALILGVLATAVCATWTDFQPLYVVSAPDKHEMRQLTGKSEADSGRKSSSSLIGGDLQENTQEKLRVIEVTGAQWSQWFRQVDNVLAKGIVPDEWMTRLPTYDLRDVKRYKAKKTSFEPDIRRIYFATQEGPLDSLKLQTEGETLIIKLDDGDGANYLRVYCNPAPKLSGLGSSIFGIPERFSYPFRHLWYIILAATLAVYALLPWPAVKKDVCAYKRWYSVLSDFAGILLFGMFAAMPLFVVGGAIQAVTEWIAFTAIFWILAALGLVIMWWSNYYAAYQIHMLADRLVFVCPGKVADIAYSNIATLEGVRAVPPKWLIILSIAGAFCGKGVSGLGQAGRAALLAGTSSDGICIGSNRDEACYVWITNSLGQVSLSHVDMLMNRLKSCNATELPEYRVIETIVPPTFESLASGRKGERVKREAGASLLETAAGMP